ncbi:ATP synthase subunit b [Youhaiella tibetensis]|uniref:ATP synthase subunit b n=1 Tax=Paradevosia tibetensis TaxID=1447062 RepID=A0A5B9DL43_9HYPH|nr:ATP F0F1 synthase subunit B [Youhaiella tibetensis]QEE19625.1 ATP F0F1 synthase subunit B [Youhaiella tibetensis]GGF31417.1 ATP synthase subunit b [Youhaiella tibetensis]
MLNFGLDYTTAATVWATIGLVIFLAIAIYAGLPKMITSMLDERIKKIEDDLAEAKRLREEAQALLADYEKKRVEAEQEAASIVTAAQEEAKRLAAEANETLKDMVTRRTKAVEDKIAQAEAQALAEVRAKSADVAIEAARILLNKQVGEKGPALIDQAIKDVGARLN